jgi:Icc protein
VEPHADATAVPELTTVADDEAVVHVGSCVRRYRNLASGTTYRLDGVEARTLRRPEGELLSVVATVNDVHFGEIECGMIDGLDIGPILRADPGEPPYPETMNAGAIAEITRLGPDAVVAKGDLTATGTVEEYDDFLRHYQEAFGDRLYQVRGNHDAETGQTFAADSVQEVVLPGVTLAIIDTVIPGAPSGRVTAAQLDWLDELAARADRPVLVFGHHHPWDPASASRPPEYFGINPDDSEALVEVFTRRPVLVGYFAGHTHRNRVRHFAGLPAVPIVEVASVKDFPGSWAEYRIFDGGILQIHRRVSSPEALRWTDRTRAMFFGNYADYSFGAISDRCFALGEPAPTR